MQHKFIQIVIGLSHYKVQTAAVIVAFTLAAGLIVHPISPTSRKSRSGRWTASVLLVSQL